MSSCKSHNNIVEQNEPAAVLPAAVLPAAVLPAAVLPFNEGVPVNRATFPSFEDLKEVFYKEDFDHVLNTVKNRMIQAKRTNQQFARMTLPDFANIKPNVVSDVKEFLRTEKRFTITEIENDLGVATGWKITLL
jgi:hypothetical protein